MYCTTSRWFLIQFACNIGIKAHILTYKWGLILRISLEKENENQCPGPSIYQFSNWFCKFRNHYD